MSTAGGDFGKKSVVALHGFDRRHGRGAVRRAARVVGFLACLSVLLGSAITARAGMIKSLDKIERNLVSREMKDRSRNFISASAALEAQLDDFGHFVNLTDRSQVRGALRELQQIEELQKEYEANGQALAEYLAENARRLRQEGLEYLLPLSELTAKNFARFNEALRDYFLARKELLTWTDDNFSELSSGKMEAKKHFDELFARCEKRMEREYDRYLDRIQFVNSFAQNHPELSDYLAADRSASVSKE
ncbi:MAG TPA: hypothetical protein VI389_06790 [Geobacteraceae bacterium]